MRTIFMPVMQECQEHSRDYDRGRLIMLLRERDGRPPDGSHARRG